MTVREGKKKPKYKTNQWFLYRKLLIGFLCAFQPLRRLSWRKTVFLSWVNEGAFPFQKQEVSFSKHYNFLVGNHGFKGKQCKKTNRENVRCAGGGCFISGITDCSCNTNQRYVMVTPYLSIFLSEIRVTSSLASPRVLSRPFSVSCAEVNYTV